MANKDELDNIRSQIDALDLDIQRLVNARAALAVEVARIKSNSAAAVQFYRPEREAQVLAQVFARNQGPYPAAAMAKLFREIMSNCLALEQELKIAFLGPAGTYSEAAARKHFGSAVKLVAQMSIDEVFRSVATGNCDFGVVPVENSTEGIINNTLDNFMRSPLKICGEVSLRIEHNLLAAVELAQISQVYAHAQSLAQCRAWLQAHLPSAECIAVVSNAEAVKIAASKQQAAIASVDAAYLYQLPVQSANIEDQSNNTTRFLIIGDMCVPPAGNDKTSLMLSAANEAGSLYRLLEPLQAANISMTRIESRPSRQGNWEYVFFLDILGHSQEAHIGAALERIQARAALFKIIGSYPRALI